MKPTQIAFTFAFIAVLVVLMAPAASATLPTRSSSGNGVDSNGANWMLMARTQPVKLSGNGKSAIMTREVVCVNQDVEDAFPSPTATLVGSCDSGFYMHLFQFRSTSANVFVAISKLVGFAADTTSANPNVGVMLCDSNGSNTVEMCTNTTAANIPNITVTSSKTSITFTIPNTFPSYSAGTAEQGAGLTFFVITDQSASPLPIQLPSVGIH